jgi:hypothetical protein
MRLQSHTKHVMIHQHSLTNNGHANHNWNCDHDSAALNKYKQGKLHCSSNGRAWKEALLVSSLW